MNKKEISERLKGFLYDKFETVEEASTYLGTTANTLRASYLSGRSIPGPELLLKLLNLGVDIEWLLTGETNKNKRVPETLNEIGDVKKKEIKTFPVVKELLYDNINDYLLEKDKIETYISIPYKHHNCIAVKVKSESMSPEIEKGDIILIDFYAAVENGNIVAARTVTGTQLIRRYVTPKHGYITFYSSNKNETPIMLLKDEIVILKRVIKVIKNV